MFRQLKSQIKGFSFVEVVVASVIFTLVAVGMFATISIVRQPAEESSEEITAAFVGKQILENLRKEVDAATWGTGPLSVGTYTNLVEVDGVFYNATYIVEDDPGTTSAKKVTMNLKW